MKGILQDLIKEGGWVTKVDTGGKHKENVAIIQRRSGLDQHTEERGKCTD